jgi:putative phosphoesterase
MNIFVVSDTHGDLTKALEMYDRLSAVCEFDLIIHCGDLQPDAIELGRILGKEVVCVRGNRDMWEKRDYKVAETPSGKILVTHGHMEDVKFSYEKLVYLAMENGCSAVCFGHTHVPENTVVAGIRILNPGSISRPRDGSDGSVAMIVATGKELAASVIYY